MASEIRANSITSRAGLSTVTLTDSGPMFSGITTFVDNSTFSVGTGGTIHAPAANTLNIGVNNTESLRIDSNSNLKVAGIVTATHFHGDGSNLTGITQTTINSNTNNYLLTATGTANTIQGESGLTFNGNILQVTDTTNGAQINLRGQSPKLYFDCTSGGTGSIFMDDHDLAIFKSVPGNPISERLRIDSNGYVMIGNSAASAQYSRDLVVGNTTGEHGITIISQSNSIGRLLFSDSTSSGAATYQGQLNYNHSADELVLTTYTLGQIVMKTNATERLRITSAGKVSIGGNASPDGDLHVYNSSAGSVTADTAANLLVLESSASQGMSILVPNNERANIRFGTTGTGGQIEAGIQYAHEAVSTTADRRAMIFRSGGGTRMRIQNQSLRIGDSTHSNAGGRLQVVEERGGQQYNDCNAYFETNANDWNIKTYYNATGTHYHMAFMEQGAHRGDIRGSDGSNVVYNSGSDYRWKENVVRITGTEGIEICKKLQPSKYNWIDNRIATGQINTVDGFIAHEVEEAGVLGAVTGEKDAVNEDGSIKGQMLDYGQMTPVLAAAIKGLITKVETLEAKVAALEGS